MLYAQNQCLTLFSRRRFSLPIHASSAHLYRQKVTRRKSLEPSRTLWSRELKLERISTVSENLPEHLTRSCDTDKAHYVITVWRKKKEICIQTIAIADN